MKKETDFDGELRRFYGMDAKCALCGKALCEHQAKTHNCPWGKRSRAGFTQFLEAQTFVPKLPKLPREVEKIVNAFEATVGDITIESRYTHNKYALTKLLVDLLQEREALAKIRAVTREFDSGFSF